jgi:hypothetical protein
MTTTTTTDLTATPTTAVQARKSHIVLVTVALVRLAAAVVAGMARWRISRGAAAVVAWGHSMAEVDMLGAR